MERNLDSYNNWKRTSTILYIVRAFGIYTLTMILCESTWQYLFHNASSWHINEVFLGFVILMFAPINTIVLLILYITKRYRNSLRRTGFLILESTAYFVVYFTLYELQQHNHYLGEMLHRTQDSLLALIVPYIILVPLCLIYISTFNHVQKSSPTYKNTEPK